MKGVPKSSTRAKKAQPLKVVKKPVSRKAPLAPTSVSRAKLKTLPLKASPARTKKNVTNTTIAKKKSSVAYVVPAATLKQENANVVEKVTPEGMLGHLLAVNKMSPQADRMASTKASVVSSRALIKPPTRSLAILSPFRFPLDSHKFMSQTARFSGLAFVILGALATLFSAQQLFPWSMAAVSVQPALVSESLVNTSTTTSDQVVPQLARYMRIDQVAPLHGIVKVTIVSPYAQKVSLFAFESSWTNKQAIGEAQQVTNDTWVFNWDTTKVSSGKDYRLSAEIVNLPGTVGGISEPLGLEYLRVDNQQLTTSTTTVAINQQPPVIMGVSASLTGDVLVRVTVADAEKLVLETKHIDSASINRIYDAKQVSPNEWRVLWKTADFRDGNYRIVAQAFKTDKKLYTSAPVTTSLVNTTNLEEDVPDDLPETATTTATVPSTIPLTLVAPLQPLVLPQATLNMTANTRLEGTEKIDIDISNGLVNSVYLYSKSATNATPRFIGAAIKVSNTRWTYNWFTKDTPNGSYIIFALAGSFSGQISSPVVPVVVFNEIVAVLTTPPPPKQISAVTETTKEIIAAAPELVPLVSPLPLPSQAPVQTALDTEERPSIIEPIQGNTTTDAQALIARYRSTLDAELMRLGSAHRINDTDAIKRIMARITELMETIESSAASNQLSATLREEIAREVENIVERYTIDIKRVDTIITERERTNVLQDTDKDGITDFDEVALYNTDPNKPDTDNDGYIDGAEILSNFDPLSDVRESLVAYESPKNTGVTREDLLTVDTIESVTPEVPLEGNVLPTDYVSAVMTGKGLPNSFVTLYIFSTPIIVTVKTDEDGSWRYRFDKELEDGEHNVYVGITDNAGRIVAKSQPLTFIKEAQAITPVEAASLGTVTAYEDDSVLLSNYVLYVIVSLSVVSIGLVLILLGFHLESRRKRYGVESVDALV